MKIGTVDTTVETELEYRKRTGLTLGPGGGRGNSGRGPGDDDGGDDHDRSDRQTSSTDSDKARILTWFILLVVLMTFGGLTAAYVVIKTNGVAEWQPFSLPVQVWISTVLLVVSSVTYHLGRRAIEHYDQPGARRWLIATTILGAAFISSQILAWIALAQRGLFVSGNPYAGFFYVLTAVHAIHVLGGIAALGSVLVPVWNTVRADSHWVRIRSLSAAVGWYWHFMDGVWLVLFVLLGFWK